MQPTQDTGTPNAIWTWTCTDCVVRDNEAFLLTAPAWTAAHTTLTGTTRVIPSTQLRTRYTGILLSSFRGRLMTRESVVRGNLCINNGLSPRLAALQGAAYLHTWNDGRCRVAHRAQHLHLESAGLFRGGDCGRRTNEGCPVTFSGNRIESLRRPFIARMQSSHRRGTIMCSRRGRTRFTLGDKRDVDLVRFSAGIEKGTTLNRTKDGEGRVPYVSKPRSFGLDADGLLAPGPRAQLMVSAEPGRAIWSGGSRSQGASGGVPVDSGGTGSTSERSARSRCGESI